MNDELHKWVVAHADGCIHVIPESDIKPHGVKEDEENYYLDFDKCGCNPKVVTGDEDGMYDTPTIVHNSFQDEKRIDESLHEPRT